MYQILKVSRSAYYYWINKKPSDILIRRLELCIVIKKVLKWSKARYGSPRIVKELQMQGIWVSRPLVSRITKKKNLRSVVLHKFTQTSNSDHKYALVENKFNQDFTTTSYNQVWLSDITYIRIREGWSYLTTVIDLFDRKVIGWQVSNNLKAKDTVIPALNKACSNRTLAAEQSVIFHSERGIQYACNEFKQLIKKHRWIKQSMSGKGNCYDKAVAESFFKTLKTELIYRNGYNSRNDAYKSVFEYIEAFYNTIRRHSHLNYLAIQEFNELHRFKYKKVAQLLFALFCPKNSCNSK